MYSSASNQTFPTMNSNALLLPKQEALKELIATKDSIERNINTLTTTLSASKFGLQGALVDDDGFPDGNTELVLSVRQSRNQLACVYLFDTLFFLFFCCCCDCL